MLTLGKIKLTAMDYRNYVSLLIPPAIAFFMFLYLRTKKNKSALQLLTRSFIWGMVSIVVVVLIIVVVVPIVLAGILYLWVSDLEDTEERIHDGHETIV